MRSTSFDRPVSRSTALMFCASSVTSGCIFVGKRPIAGSRRQRYRTASHAVRTPMNTKRAALAAFAIAAAAVVLLGALHALKSLPGRDVVDAVAPIAAIGDSAEAAPGEAVVPGED